MRARGERRANILAQVAELRQPKREQANTEPIGFRTARGCEDLQLPIYAPLPKTTESEKARVVPFVPANERPVECFEALPIGELYETIEAARKSPRMVASITSTVRTVNGKKFRGQYLDQAYNLIGTMNQEAQAFWFASEYRIRFVERMLEHARPFGATVRVKRSSSSSGTKPARVLTPEQQARKIERGNIQALMRAINALEPG